MHNLGYIPPKETEALGEGFLKTGLLEAQRLSRNALQKIAESIRPGMTEQMAMAAADRILRSQGSPRSWHRTIIRFGENTALPYSEKGNIQRVLAEGEIFFIDIGPNWLLPSYGNVEYEGDVGDTYIAGKPSEDLARCIDTTRSLFHEGSKQWHEKKLTGDQIYDWLSKRARELGYETVPEDDGHRIGDFPHKRFFGNGLTEVPFTPASDLWVLEIHLIDPKKRFGAFFEDVLRSE